MTSSRLWRFLTLCALWFTCSILVGCGSDDSKSVTCAPGTKAVDGTCEVIDARDICGEGTVFKEGKCVPTTSGGADAGDMGPSGGDSGMSVGDMSLTPDQGTCVTRCFGRSCGPDGCGGTCGICDDPAQPVCNTNDGQCAAVCVPNCRDRFCGPDGCGGSCGTCASDQDECTDQGHCVPKAWSCEKEIYNALDHCDCACGAPDPDCAMSGLATLGCAPLDVCRQGTCDSAIPAGWTCSPLSYKDGYYCHCGCGVPDPDCAINGATVLGCQGTSRCSQTDATCQACMPDCTNKVCGDDGCGGVCGECGGGLTCVSGACSDACPVGQPPQCNELECGPDLCGNDCGSCVANATCTDGSCVPDPGMSCLGHCNASAPGGCGCDDGCGALGDCCPDYQALCTCTPDCTNKVCGDDGCGGSCGLCTASNAPFCNGSGQCQAVCVPQCGSHECGDDGCGGSCGLCGVGESCNDSKLCVPPEWVCLDELYGDGRTCDCACRAADPDCQTLGNVYGCPLGTRCTAQGLCDISYCSAQSDCPGPAWCVGHYPTSGIARKGVCEKPVASASPPGTLCNAHDVCATEVCAAGLCRDHCQRDMDCFMGQTCVGAALQDPLLGHALGVVSVCDSAAGLHKGCTSHAQCTGAGELCLATIDPITFSLLYRCGRANGPGSVSAFCDEATECALGLVCVNNGCAKPCPGGQGECGMNQMCMQAKLHGGASTSPNDDVLVDTCITMTP